MEKAKAKTKAKRKGGAEKLRARKKQALRADAAACVKITDMFSTGAGPSSAPVADIGGEEDDERERDQREWGEGGELAVASPEEESVSESEESKEQEDIDYFARPEPSIEFSSLSPLALISLPLIIFLTTNIGHGEFSSLSPLALISLPLIIFLTTNIGHGCTCECCRADNLEAVQECVCCRELAKVQALNGNHGGSCITQHPGFEAICLNEYVLDVAYSYYKQNHGHLNKSPHEYVLLDKVCFLGMWELGTKWGWHNHWFHCELCIDILLVCALLHYFLQEFLGIFCKCKF
ncbi:hypothetical protein F7725_000039 [Dissostichus mawsoni]|uniref:Uncharacterized protein n=1 Tax=Dissostichus mawsoni TaxID=36200 RepID=A0A7J5ZI15_DISMA|nr:hypothetical protein F7725_000039 [Dissostichus mawsoni]